MKRGLCGALALALAISCGCVTALAADAPTQAGIYNVTASGGVSVTVPGVTGSAATIDGKTVTFYPGGEKVSVAYSGGEGQYLVLALAGSGTIPTESNIAYIDQNETASFTVYPGSLASGETYHIYLSSDAATGIQGLTEVGSFQYYAPYTLGDVNEDTKINTVDAMQVVNHFVGNTTLTGNRLLAADVNKDSKVNTVDAMRIVNLFVGNIDQF